MKCLLILAFLMYCSTSGILHAQGNFLQTQQQVDSVRRVIELNLHAADTLMVSSCNYLSFLYRQRAQYDSAMYFARKAEKIAQDISFRSGLARTFSNIARILNLQGKRDEALEYTFKTLRLYEELGDKRGLAPAMMDLVNIYFQQKRLSELRQHIDRALALYEELSDKRGIALCLEKIGVYYALQQQHSQALPYFLRALHIQESLGDKQGYALTLLNIASSNFFQNKLDSALVYHQKAFRLHEELGTKDNILLSLNNLGFLYQRLSKFPESISYSLRALTLADSIGARQSQYFALVGLSLAYDSLGQYKQSLEYFRRATTIHDSLISEAGAKKTSELQVQYDIDRKNKEILLLQTNKELQTLRFTNQANALAREHAESERQRQMLLLVQNERQLQRLTLNQQEAQLTEARLVGERDKQALALAEKDKSLSVAELREREAEIQRQRVIQWSLAAILLGAVMAALWLGRLYQQKRLANQEILRQQTVLQDQAAEIELINSQMHETNIGLDAALHDLKATQSQLVQSERMNAVGMLTAGVMHEINNPNAIAYSAISQSRTKLGEMNAYFLSLLDDESKDSAEVRKFQELSNEALSRLDLASDGSQRVKTIVANLQGFTKHQETDSLVGDWAKEIRGTVSLFQLQFQNVSVETALPDTIRIKANFGELNQVLLNLLVNAAQANATELTLQAEQKETQAILRLTDNGAGMSVETVKKIFEPFFSTKDVGNSGLGLSISKQIVERHDGRIHCESTLGKGATFIIELPAVSSLK
jgi:two-component system, NtrC family, sensor kinase